MDNLDIIILTVVVTSLYVGFAWTFVSFSSRKTPKDIT